MDEIIKHKIELYKKDDNLLQLPIFFFCRKGKNKIKHQWENENGAKCQIRCMCDMGIPGAFEQDVYSATLRFLVLQGCPEYIEVSYFDIAKALNLNPKTWHTKIRKAIYKLSMARYEFTNCFYDKSKQTFTKETLAFSLFSTPRLLDSSVIGRKRSKLELNFPSIITNNMKGNYFRWIDFEMYKSLPSGLTRRLYEYLHKRRYGDNKFVIGVEKLCRWLPIDDTNKTRTQKRICTMAESLRKTGYLKAFWYDKKKNVCHFTYNKEKFPKLNIEAETCTGELQEDCEVEQVEQQKSTAIPQKQAVFVCANEHERVLLDAVGKKIVLIVREMPGYKENLPAVIAEYRAQKSTIRNPVGWFRDAIKKGFRAVEPEPEPIETPISTDFDYEHEYSEQKAISTPKKDAWDALKIGDSYNGETITNVEESAFLTKNCAVPYCIFAVDGWKRQ